MTKALHYYYTIAQYICTYLVKFKNSIINMWSHDDSVVKYVIVTVNQTIITFPYLNF